MQLEYKNVKFKCDSPIDESEAQAYVDMYLERFGDNLKTLYVKSDGDYADIKWALKSDDVPFERINRRTYFRVGSSVRFNPSQYFEAWMLEHVKNPDPQLEEYMQKHILKKQRKSQSISAMRQEWDRIVCNDMDIADCVDNSIYKCKINNDRK